jgi:hypothetical protein
MFAWLGRSYDPDTLAATVAASVAGAHVVPTHPPAAWLCGLLEASKSTPAHDLVTARLNLALHAANAAHLPVLAEVASAHDVLQPGLLVDALRRNLGTADTLTLQHLAAAVAAAICSGRLAYDGTLLRALGSYPELIGPLLPAWLHADHAWFLVAAPTLFGADPGTAHRRLAALAETLPEPRRASLAAALALVSASAAWQDAAQTAAQQGVAAPTPDGPSPARLPWRGDDGRFFVLPPGGEPPPGPYRVRRGSEQHDLDPRAAATFEISLAQARALHVQEVNALYAALRQSLLGALGPSVDLNARLPPRLADLTGRSTEELVGPLVRDAQPLPVENVAQLAHALRGAALPRFVLVAITNWLRRALDGGARERDARVPD